MRGSGSEVIATLLRAVICPDYLRSSQAYVGTPLAVRAEQRQIPSPQWTHTACVQDKLSWWLPDCFNNMVVPK